MGFIINNEQQRQRISISPEAMIVLEQDVTDFGLDGIGELVNNILLYLEKYRLTQETTLIQYRSQTYSYLKNAGIESDIDIILEKLCKYKKKEIMDTISQKKTHRRGNIGKNIYIKQQVLRWLESSENTEDEYYGGSLLLYLNCIIEDYVNKDMYTRETIAIHERISKINSYIKDAEWINIYWPDKPSKRVFPLKVMPDKMNTHAYLVGYALSDKGKLIPSSYRISSLPDDMQIDHGYNPQVTDSDIKRLYELIKERRVDFLHYKVENIRVRMSKKGLERYTRTARLRPDIISSEQTADGDTICTFHCSCEQARYYFTSLGEGIEIISPKDLRKKFKKIYNNALSMYSNSSSI